MTPRPPPAPDPIADAYVSPTAAALAGRRARATPFSCAAGAHWFRRHPDGTRIWVCTRCHHEQPFVLPEQATP